MDEIVDNILKASRSSRSPILFLGGRGLSKLPEQVFEMDWIRELRLDDNQLTTIPDIKFANKIQRLSLSQNKISNLKGIDKYSNLISFNGNSNQITDIKGVEECNHLEELSLSKNQITQFDSIQNLTKLFDLRIASNNLKSIEGIQNLSELKTLMAQGNQLDSGLDFVASLLNLEAIFLGGTPFEIQLDTFSNNKKLALLSIKNAGLKNIDFLENLKNISSLDLSNNLIKDISVLENMTNLLFVIFNNNLVEDITPLSFLTLKNAQFLNNKIRHFSRKFLSNTNLEVSFAMSEGRTRSSFGTIELDYNGPMEELSRLELGKQALLDYWEELDKARSSFNEAKMIILGEPDSGKTSLMRYIRGDTFEDKKSVTKGISIEKWLIDDYLVGCYQINIWDFGGQEMQQGMHQYFITEDALYIILLDAVSDQQPEKYINYLNNHAPNSPFIIVINKVEEDKTGHQGHRIKNNLLYDNYSDRLKGIFRISLKEAANGNVNHRVLMDELVSIITESFLQLPSIQSPQPASYLAVKKRIEQKYNQGVSYISYETFVLLCTENGIKQESAISLLSWLNKIGTLQYKDSHNTKAIQVLNPEWLSEGIYGIMNHTITETLKGVISVADLPKILYNDGTSRFTYNESQYDYLIAMMQHYKVAYYHKTEQKLFIPTVFDTDLISSIKRSEYKQNAIHFFYKYDYEVPSFIMHQFIVSHFNERMQQNSYWKQGIIIKDIRYPSKPCIALVEQNDRQIDIWVSGEYYPQFYLEIIRETFRKIHLETKEPQQGFFEIEQGVEVAYETIIGLKLRGKKEYSTAEKDYNIDEDILKVFETESAIAKLERKEGNKIFIIFLASSSELKEDRRDFEIFINRENTNLIYENVFLKLEVWEDFLDCMDKDGLQARYNRAIKNCDIFVSLFFKKVGKFTEQEFEVAFGKFTETSKPKIYTYFKNADVKTGAWKKEDFYSLDSFETKLAALGHHKTGYENIQDLKYQFKMQLDKLIPIMSQSKITMDRNQF